MEIYIRFDRQRHYRALQKLSKRYKTLFKGQIFSYTWDYNTKSIDEQSNKVFEMGYSELLKIWRKLK